MTPDGMPVGYEVFAGNRADTTTMREIVMRMEEKYGRANRVWVTDRGMSREENIAFLQGRDAFYLMGASRSLLKRYDSELHDDIGWQTIRDGLSVKLVRGSDNEKNEACGITLTEKPGHLEWTEKTHGAYILRTDMDCEAPAELWR